MREPIRIFVSSPGDVAEERALAERVIDRLRREWIGTVPIDAFLWEHEPLRATATYQDEIDRLCRPSEADIVVSLLWCRFGSRLPPGVTRPDGTAYASGTEYELEDAAAGYERTRVRPTLLLYKKTARLLVDLDDPKYAERRRQKDALEGFLRDWATHADGTAKRAIHVFEAAADFEDLVERHLEKVVSSLVDRAGQRARAAPVWRESPFRGLGVFEPEHAPIFFGRTAAASAVVGALRARDARAEAFVAVVGASGSGKSSLVRAGVLPLLMSTGVMGNVGLWRQAIFVPGQRDPDVFSGLAGALTETGALPELTSSGRTVAELAAMLREQPASLGVIIEGALRQATALLDRNGATAAPTAGRLALVIDQMEQLFSAPSITAQDRDALIASFASAVKARSAVIVATIRSDFFERCHAVPGLLALMQGEGQYQLQAAGPAELERIISRPATLAGLEFEAGTETRLSLDQRLRDAALDSPHSLPLLEFALQQLYERRTPEGRLTHAAYDDIGELQGAVANHAEQAFVSWSATLAQGPQAATARDAALGALLRSLVTLQADSDQVTARRVAEDELPEGAPRDLANALVAARLLVKDTDRSGRPVLAVAHEAVLREWPRARTWLVENLAFVRARARVSADQSRWEASNPARVEERDAGFLLPDGRRLAEAQELLRRHRADLDPATVDYIQASTRQAARATVWRRSSYAALFLLLAGTAFGVYAILQARQLDRQQRLAVAYRLAAQAELIRDQQPGLSALLASESLARHLSVEADIALRRSLAILPELAFEHQFSMAEVSEPPGRYVVERHLDQGLRTFDMRGNVRSRWLLGDVARALTLSNTHVTPDGKRIVNLTWDTGGSRLRIVETATGTVTEVPFDGRFDRTAISLDGRRVAAVNSSRVLAWDLGGAPPRAYARPIDWEPGRIQFSGDGRYLAITAGSRVHIFSAELRDAKVIERSSGVNSIAFAPGGDLIVVGNSNEVCFVALAAPEAPACTPQDQSTTDLAFDNSGSLLAVAGEAGVVRILEVKSRSQKSRLAHDKQVVSVQWNAAGTLLAATTRDDDTGDTVHVWNVEFERQIARLPNEGVLWFDAALTTVSKVPPDFTESRVRQWALQDGLMEQRLLSHSQWAHDLAFSPDSTSIFTGSGYIGDDTTDTRDYNARAWPLARGGEPVVMPHDQAVGAVRPLQDGRYLVTAGWFYMGVWDLSQQRAVARIECETPHDELEGAQIAFALSRDGRLLACHTDDERIQVFAIHNGQRVGPEHTGDGAVTGIALNDDGSLLAMERGQTLEIIEVNAKPKPVARAELETEGAMLAFIPGTDRLAVVSESGVRLFDVKRKAWDALRIDEPIDVLPRISPDGRRIVLAKGNRASVWDLTSGRRLIHLAHPVEIKDSDLSRDGRFLATAGLDGVARVWDLATGREQVRLAASSNRSDDSASRVVFSPDGRFLATKHGFDVRVWQIRPEDLRAEACRRVRGNLTAAERTEYISAADACTPTCAAFPACSQGESAAPPRVMK